MTRQNVCKLTGAVPMINMMTDFPVCVAMDLGHTGKIEVGIGPVFKPAVHLPT